MKEAAAKRLAELLLRHCAEQNDFVKKSQTIDQPNDFTEIKNIIGKTMGAIYLDGLHSLYEEHSILKPDGLA